MQSMNWYDSLDATQHNALDCYGWFILSIASIKEINGCLHPSDQKAKLLMIQVT